MQLKHDHKNLKWFASLAVEHANSKLQLEDSFIFVNNEMWHWGKYDCWEHHVAFVKLPIEHAIF